MKKIRLICLLGNPGKEYQHTRHNLPWTLPETDPRWESSWKKKFQGSFTQIRGTVLLKPETYMNLSGASVQSALSFFKISPDEMLVLHDDLELPFGAYAWKRGGGTAGHKGLKSIGQTLGTEGFIRLRLGIGRPERGSLSNWVLQPFTEMERAWIPELWKSLEGQLDQVLAGQDPPWDRKQFFMEAMGKGKKKR